jgi:hypothetical protein
MSDYAHAIFCGLIGGILSPVCFLSTILGGGMSVGLRWSSAQKNISFQKSLLIGCTCGLASGTSALLFWYVFFFSIQKYFLWFFSHSSGQKLLDSTAPHLWHYGLIHFFLCIPLSLMGALISYALQER